MCMNYRLHATNEALGLVFIMVCLYHEMLLLWLFWFLSPNRILFFCSFPLIDIFCSVFALKMQSHQHWSLTMLVLRFQKQPPPLKPLRTTAHGAPGAWNSRAAQTHRQPPNLSHKLCLVHGKDHVALQRSRGGENEEFGGNWVGIGRIRLTFLSRDVISRQGQTKANTQDSKEREEKTNLCLLLKITFLCRIQYHISHVA